MNKWISKLAIACLSPLLITQPHAQQAYPEKPVRIIVPAPAGGTVDGFSRVIAENLAAKWKQSIVVEPLPGAASNIGTMAVKNSTADGYTWLATTSSTFLANPHLFKAAAWNPTKDFVGVAALGHTSTVLVVPKSVPANTMGELIALIKAKPDSVTAGMVFGTTAQLNFELLKRLANLQLVMAPFNGAPPITLALLSGSIQMGLLQPGVVLTHIQSKRLKAIAVAGPKRDPLLPDVPTFAEVGYPEVRLTPWYGFTVPRGTPKHAIIAMNRAINAALDDQNVKSSLVGLGVDIGPKMSVEEVNAMLEADGNNYSNVIKSLGITSN